MAITFGFGGDDETTTEQDQNVRQIGIQESHQSGTQQTRGTNTRSLTDNTDRFVDETIDTTGSQRGTTATKAKDELQNLRNKQNQEREALNEALSQLARSQEIGTRKGSTVGGETNVLLSEAVRQQLGGIIGEQQGVSGAIQDNARLLQQRGVTAENDLLAAIAPQIAEARRQGEVELGQAQSALRLAAGGRGGNSVAELLALSGREDLETRLAGLRGSLALQARQQGSNEIAAGGQLLSQAGGVLGDTARIGDVLKGAVATKRTTLDELLSSQLDSAQTSETTKELLKLLTGEEATTEDQIRRSTAFAEEASSFDTSTVGKTTEATQRLQDIVDTIDQTTVSDSVLNNVEALVRDARLRGVTDTDSGFDISFEL